MASLPSPAKIAAGGLLLLVPVVLTAWALPRFTQGLRIEPAHNIVTAAVVGTNLSPSRFEEGAAAFGQTSDDDGEGLAVRAELAELAADGDKTKLAAVKPIVIAALEHEPVNPRAWTILCEVESVHARADAVRCLDTAFFVARYDWYIADRRMGLVAWAWPDLDEHLRDSAASMIIPMWNTDHWPSGQSLRDVLFDLSRSANGRALLRAGLISDIETLHSFNRWVMRERINGR